MINWFGPASWGAPICRECPRCDIPVGTLCLRCERGITVADSGVTMPYMGGPSDERTVAAFHLDCHLKSILPHDKWRENNLTPDTFDGVKDGVFMCKDCRVVWTKATGWEPWL